MRQVKTCPTKETPMDELLTLTLDLKPPTAIRGETVFFEAILKNTSTELAQELAPMGPRLDSLEITIEGPALNATSKGELGGSHRHVPLEPENLVNLGPGKDMRKGICSAGSVSSRPVSTK